MERESELILMLLQRWRKLEVQAHESDRMRSMNLVLYRFAGV
jgi:hypothetical protein